jgi:tetratricopeptide (TPR) repeat protein
LHDRAAHREGPASDTLPAADVAALTARASALRKAGDSGRAAQLFTRIADALPAAWLAQYNAGAALLEAGLLDESAVRLERAVACKPSSETYRLHAHVLALRGDMAASATAYAHAVRLSPDDFDAHWGLFEVLQLLDDNAAAVAHQRIALAQRSLVTIEASVGPARVRLLELCIAGTFQANVPLDFILDRRHVTVHKLYVGEHPIPELPPYDLVFNAIADAPNAGPALRAAQAFIAAQDRPALNAPAAVPLTSRDAVVSHFADSDAVAVASIVRATRGNVRALQPAFPFLIRPLDSHAGNDLAKVDCAAELDAYLHATPEVEEFYLSAFVDYRNADGYFRKYRIVFVEGVPYPVHLAISPRWMIHYYNAPMAENAWMRDEEHAFLRDIDAVFDGPRARGLREIAAAIPLDYFGIDASIAPDGRVLLFEASAAMIVHLRDPIALYPYKARYVPRIIDALERLFAARMAHGGSA